MKTLLFAAMTVVLAGCGCRDEGGSAKAPQPPSSSKQVLQEFVTPGRTNAEVTNRLGAPSSVTEEDGRIVMTFAARHDLLAIDVGRVQERWMATVIFTNGVVETSKYTTVSTVRRKQ